MNLEMNLALLEELSNSFGPSGFEREATLIMKNYVKTFSDEVIADKTGSIAFSKKGTSSEVAILLPGHVDEVGFMISSIETTGYLTIQNLGGWWSQTLLSQRVRIKTESGEEIIGIIIAKPPHVLPAAERNKVVELKNMFVDIGCNSKEEVEELGIRIGSPVVPDSTFMTIERKRKKKKKEGEEEKQDIRTLCLGKAFDDRVGAFIAAETLRTLKEKGIEHPNTVYGAATVQEEVGLRGAKTLANTLWEKIGSLDLNITIETDIAGDVPGIKPNQAPAKMGEGVSIFVYDGSMIPNQPLLDFVIKTAKENDIPYQLSMIKGGGTDAGAIHLSYSGVPSIVLGVPTRHIHSHTGMLDLKDVESCINLLLALLPKLDKETIEKFTEI